jgi:hypothetical protein
MALLGLVVIVIAARGVTRSSTEAA